ncbi:hypothetical protein WJX77_008767 [Trebouxia sp. C0004]
MEVCRSAAFLSRQELKVLPESESPTQFFAWVRKDNDLLLKELLDSPQAHGMCLESRPLFDSNGERMYMDFASGKWLQQTQAAARRDLHPLANVLGLMLYSDGAQAANKKHNYHPIIMYLANFTLDAMRSSRACNKSVFCNTGALSQAFKTLCYSGFQHRCTDGHTRFFVPTLAAFVGDIMEANTAFGILHHAALHSDISTLVHKSCLNDPEHEPEARIESQMVTAIQESRSLQQAKRISAAKQKLHQYSLALAQLTPLAGFRFVPNVFDLYFPDRLHQSNLASAQVIIRFIQQLFVAEMQAFNDYFKTLSSFPAFNIPSFGLTPDGKATASEYADLFKVLPVAMLAVARARSLYLHPTQELLEFQTLRDLEQHTESSLQALDEQRKRAQHACLGLMKTGPDGNQVSMQTSGWAMPKFHLMRMWPATIRAFGSANVTSTGFGERSHIILKDCFRFTNRHSAEAVDEQTLVNASWKRTAETMAADAEAAEPSVEKRSSSAAQKACETGCTCLSSGRTGMVYVGSTDTTAISAQLPNHPHILLLLQRALSSYLAGPQATVPSLVADMPRTVDRKVWVSTGLGIAHQLHRGSSKEGVMLSAGDCVRIRGDSPAEVWYAELLLLFSFKTRGPIEPERSNAELQTAIQDVGPDSDFEQAIEENILTIARQQAKVERLDREIEEAKSSSHQLEPVPTGNAGVFPAGQASAINHDPPRFILAAGLQRDAFDQHHMSTEAIRGNSQQSQALMVLFLRHT